MPPQKLPDWLDPIFRGILNDGILCNYPLTYDVEWIEPMDPLAIPWWQLTVFPAYGRDTRGEEFWEDILVATHTITEMFAKVDPEYWEVVHVTAGTDRLVLEIPSRNLGGREAVVLVVNFSPREDNTEPVFEILDEETCCYKEVEAGILHNAPDSSPPSEMN